MKNTYKVLISTAILSSTLITGHASATVFEFHFTGQYTLVDPGGNYLDQQAIDSTLTYDDSTGSGFSAGLAINNFDTFGNTATIYDISLQRSSDPTSNLVIGNMLADWGVNIAIPLSMVWDATGLFNAIDFGLQSGDVISGSSLKRNDVVITDVNSAIPATDGTLNPNTGSALNQGAAPLAMTSSNTFTLCNSGSDCIGNTSSGGEPFFDDGIAGSPMIGGPFTGLNVNFDIGSGNSLTVLSVSAVPVPAAVWLFGTGLIGLIGIARRKKA